MIVHNVLSKQQFFYVCIDVYIHMCVRFHLFIDFDVQVCISDF